MTITTIKLKKETKERLEKLKENRRESFDDIIRKLLYVLNVNREDPFKSKRILERISELRERWLESEKKEDEERASKDVQKKVKKAVKRKVVVRRG